MTAPSNANFGVGCFLFAVADCHSVAEWFEKVEAALGTIGSIKEISTDRPPDIFRDGFTVNLNESTPDIYLQPTGGSVKFQISIPERLQRKSLSLMPYVVDSVSTTDFEVTTAYHPHGPVTFVHCLNPTHSDQLKAAMSVAIMREYLRDEFRKLDDTSPVSLHVVGPSPFWADFRIITGLHSESPTTEDPIRVTRSNSYSLVEFRFFDDASASDAKDAVFAFLREELSLYYSEVRAGDIHRGEVSRISEMLAELISLHQRRGFLASVRRVFRTSRLARHVVLETLQAEANGAARKRESQESLSSLSKSRQRVLFLEEIQAEADTAYLGELRTMKEAAIALESGRTKEFEVAIIASSTLLGGIAGAVAAILTK